MDDYISKPLHLKDLLRVVAHYGRSTRLGQQPDGVKSGLRRYNRSFYAISGSGRSGRPPDRFPHHGEHLRQGGGVPRPLRSGAVPHRPHQQRAFLSAAEGGDAGRAVAGAPAGSAAGAGLRARWIPATPRCARWSATAARRRISTPPPTTAPTCARPAVDRSGKPAHGRHDRGATTAAPSAAACAICARATGSWSGCAASAWCPNPRSATACRSPSCPTASPRSARWKPPCARPPRWCGRPSSRS